MRNSRPEWYEGVKGSFVPKLCFDEELKAKVIRRIEQRSVSKRSAIKRVRTIAAVCTLLLIVGIFASHADWLRQENSWQSGTGGEISLLYTALENGSESSIMEPQHRRVLQTVPLSEVNITNAYTFEGIGQYITYEQPHKDSHPYDGLVLEEHASAEQGQLLEYGYGGLTDVELARSEAFGEFDYRLSGRCGPYILCTRWFSTDGGKVISELQLNSPAYEHDLDRDGIKEVVLAGTPYFRERVYVLKKRNGRIEYVDLNAALKLEPPDKIIYDDANRLFQIWTGGELDHLYRYANGEDKLQLIRQSNASTNP